MDSRFNEIHTDPENQIFKVVFYPDRIYHAAYLNATRSQRYRYNVTEVRNQLDITVLRGEVYLDGQFLCNFLRVEYRASRLTELAREKGRFIKDEILAWMRLNPIDASKQAAEEVVKLRYCPWVDAFQVEIWETLEPPLGKSHDYRVQPLMGRFGSITKVKAFNPLLGELKAVRRIEIAFRENERDLPFGYAVVDPEWDNNFTRSHQEPRRQEPSSPMNTVEDQNYLIDFQRGWFLNAKDVQPVRYRNAMMAQDDPEGRQDNIIEMKWLIQRELGSSVVFFHEVTIPPRTVEGTHRHVGTEEVYFITEGKGIAYMGENDDPNTASFPTVEREIYTLGKFRCKELPVEPGSVIYTKSGGIHGIRNDNDKPLKFVAFLYHTV